MDNDKKELVVQRISDIANNNEDFCKALVTAVDAVEVKKVLAENGIELSSEEVNEFLAAGTSEIEKYVDVKEGEMTDEEMDEISGGVLIGSAFGPLVKNVWMNLLRIATQMKK